MTNEERDIITQFIARVGGAQAPGQGTFGGSVPATTAPPLPPVDPEADRLIAEQFSRYPEARYRLTQLAFIQEHALAEAQNRIQRLEWEAQQARQAAQQAQQQPAGSSGGGFFGGLFGGGSRSAPPPQQGGPGPAWNQGPGPAPNYQQGAPPPPQYAPGYQQGMFQRQGSGFLGSALTTAAGVAGGLVAGNALMNLFSGSHGMGGGFGGGFGGGGAAASPWGTAPTAPDQGYIDQGTWSDPAGGAGTTDPGYVDNGTWDTPGGGDQSSLTDNSGGSDPGWDTGGGGGGSDDDSLI
ncbi:MAG TPA: DUF2076 domain-containing protein [Acetobacteraceae bacterium]|jgi:hypothetical protein|nr:DUF2076 domain-containing protein [Acetobacteraceae bacterium]